MQKSNPELIVKSSAIDLELTALLGGEPRDFLVMCFDGVQLEFFGTPYDSPTARSNWKILIDELNEKSKRSLWPKMFESWRLEICKQFGLAAETTHKDFRPVVSYKVSRVCHGYSEHLHCAIGLFETLADRIEDWNLGKCGGKSHVGIIGKDGREIAHCGDNMPLVIAEAVRMFLTGACPPAQPLTGSPAHHGEEGLAGARPSKAL